MDSSKNCCPFVTKLCAVTKLGDLTVVASVANPDPCLLLTPEISVPDPLVGGTDLDLEFFFIYGSRSLTIIFKKT